MRSTAQRRLFGVLATALVLGWGPLQAAQPSEATIVLDGSFDDWQTVLANPFNTIYDGDGSSIPCAGSSDRDCIVPSATSDLRRFAFTWDDQNLYFLIQRFAAANNKSFVVYLDKGDNGLMESSGDLVLTHLFKISQGVVQPGRYLYAPLGGSSDPIVDALGFGDGYSLPGGLGAAQSGPSDPGDCTTCASADGLTFEFAWPWAALGMTPGQKFGFHVAGTNTAGSTADDNMAGRYGKKGSSAFVLHTVDGPLVQSSTAGTDALLAHVVTNAGNVKDVVNLHVTSSLGLTTCLYTDPNMDGQPDAELACDRRGDGDYTDQGDSIMPGADSDGDTSPDLGSMDAGLATGLVVKITIPNGTSRRVEYTTIQTASTTDPTIGTEIVDRISIGDVVILPPLSRLATPGATLPLAHRVENLLPVSDTFEVSVTVPPGWSCDLWSDPDGDGDPSDGARLFDTDGDTVPDVTLTAGGSFPIVGIVTVAAGAAPGTGGSVTLTVTANGNVTGSVMDAVSVRDPLTFRQNYIVAEGKSKAGSPTYPVFYRHTIEWAGSAPDRFDLIALSNKGYPVDFFTDPDGNGNPSDGVVMPEPVQTPTLEPFGGTFHFLVRVSIPSSAVPGDLDTTTVYAVSQTDPAQTNAQLLDQTQVTLIQVFEDPSRTEVISHTPPCTTIYARARGIVPSQAGRYRILWEDALGTAVRVTPFSSDAAGEGFDQIDLPADAPLGLWAVAVQEDQGGAWTDLDRIPLEVEDGGDMDSLLLDPEDFNVLDESLTVTSIFRNNGQSDMGPLDLRFRVLSPSGSLYLDPSGAFLPFSGTEETWITAPFSLVPGESVQHVWSVNGIQWAETGIHTLQAFWQSACGATVASASKTFVLYADYDGDGLDDLQEKDAGLDPTDRDSDDDGLEDGLDGFGDADGDTVPDGLDCDSDGDGLTDGLEAGVTAATAGPDTDLASPCFVPDADGGATTSDPKLADTDGGGLPDGFEDRDRDGERDFGEGDLRNAADDACAPVAPIEVGGLTARREGSSVLLSWDPHPDACVTYRILTSTDPSQSGAYVTAAEGVLPPEWLHSGVVPDGPGLRSWLLQAVSLTTGDGSLGHFGQ